MPLTALASLNRTASACFLKSTLTAYLALGRRIDEAISGGYSQFGISGRARRYPNRLVATKGITGAGGADDLGG
jgi:hypothetical protein